MKKSFAVLYVVVVMMAGFGSATAQDMKNITPPLSDTQLIKIVGTINKSEKVKVIVSDFAALLGLPSDQKNTFKFHVFKTADGVFHVFARINEQSGYIVINRTKDIVSFLHVNAELRLIAAATDIAHTSMAFKVLPVPEATKLLNEELTAWANYADTSLPKPKE